MQSEEMNFTRGPSLTLADLDTMDENSFSLHQENNGIAFNETTDFPMKSPNRCPDDWFDVEKTKNLYGENLPPKLKRERNSDYAIFEKNFERDVFNWFDYISDHKKVGIINHLTLLLLYNGKLNDQTQNQYVNNDEILIPYHDDIDKEREEFIETTDYLEAKKKEKLYKETQEFIETTHYLPAKENEKNYYPESSPSILKEEEEEKEEQFKKKNKHHGGVKHGKGKHGRIHHMNHENIEKEQQIKNWWE